MARLVVTCGRLRDEVIELRWGVNCLGRGAENHFQFDDPAVSHFHCEIVVSGDGVTVRDRNSTNGTYVDGRRVQEAKLQVGQKLCIGNTELLVEAADTVVSIPRPEKSDASQPAPRSDGTMPCPRHPHFPAVYRCTNCHALLCDMCLHKLRRRGGQMIQLCPFCIYKCEPIVAVKPARKSFTARVWDRARTALLRRQA